MDDLGCIDSNIITDVETVNTFTNGLKELKYSIKNELNSYDVPTYNYYKYLTLIMKYHNKPINKFWYLKNEYNPIWLKCNKKRR